jgi:hypothetical protein
MLFLTKLEFLDVNAGIKKTADDDIDFDYIYHLPTANPDQIRYRDPFKSNKLPSKAKAKSQQSLAMLSQVSNHSIAEIRGMLSSRPDMQPSVLRSRGTINRSSNKLGASQNSQLARSFFQNGSETKSNKSSVQLKDDLAQIVVNDVVEDENGDLVVIQTEVSRFKAMPDIVYNYVDPNVAASVAFGCMVLLVGQVIVSQFTI